MGTRQPTIVNTPAAGSNTFGIKQVLQLVARLFAVFVAMLIAFVVSGAVIDIGLPLSPEQSSESARALIIVSLMTSLVLAYPILRSRWYGVKLMAAVLVVQFGVETFMSQIETLFFSGALKLPVDLVMRIIMAGFVRALVFAPLAVLLLGKLRGTPILDDTPRLVMATTEWIKRFAILAILYVVVYFAFGYFVAFQWVETREYYAGTFANDLSLPLFQVLRGVLWAALALPIVALMRGKAWETCLAVALVFSFLIASGLIFPNPFMPPLVRQAHFYELVSSMLTYGAIAGWVWTREGSLLSRQK